MREASLVPSNPSYKDPHSPMPIPCYWVEIQAWASDQSRHMGDLNIAGHRNWFSDWYTHNPNQQNYRKLMAFGKTNRKRIFFWEVLLPGRICSAVTLTPFIPKNEVNTRKRGEWTKYGHRTVPNTTIWGAESSPSPELFHPHGQVYFLFCFILFNLV